MFMKLLIKKILKEQIENDDKSYEIYKKWFNKDFNDNIELSAQVFVDNSRKVFFDSSGKVIEMGLDCIKQPYCYCQLLKEQITWSDDMMKSDWIHKFNTNTEDKYEKDLFEMVPYSFMYYGYTGYESMYLYNRLFRELREKAKC